MPACSSLQNWSNAIAAHMQFSQHWNYSIYDQTPLACYGVICEDCRQGNNPWVADITIADLGFNQWMELELPQDRKRAHEDLLDRARALTGFVLIDRPDPPKPKTAWERLLGDDEA